MRNHLAELLADLVDDKHLALAVEIDEHLRQQWEARASPEYKEIMKKFESNPSNDSAAELILYILLMEAMLNNDFRIEQGAGGISVSEADKI